MFQSHWLPPYPLIFSSFLLALHTNTLFIPPLLSSRLTEEHKLTRTFSHKVHSEFLNIFTALYHYITNPGHRLTGWNLCLYPCLCILYVCVCVSSAAHGCLWVSVGLIGGKQRSINRFHAGGAGEGSHQPVIYTVHMVDVHAGQEPDGVSVYKVHHTDDTPV